MTYPFFVTACTTLETICPRIIHLRRGGPSDLGHEFAGWRLWADSALVEIPARTADEPRWLLVGKIDQKHWSAVITRRGENIRQISVRRSRDEEATIYESQDI